MPSNVFHNLIKNEDSFTEGFVNLLELSKTLRERFAGLLNKRFKLDPPDGFTEASFGQDVSTQQQDQAGRPDIVVVDFAGTPNRPKTLLIEVKIELATGLQRSQKKLYKGAFGEYSATDDRFVLFIIPARYRHRDEVTSGIETNPDIKAAYVTWEEILRECLQPATDRAQSTQADCEGFVIGQYASLLVKKLSFIDLQCTHQEFEVMRDPKTISAFLRLSGLIETVRQWEEDEYGIRGKSWIDVRREHISLYLRGKTNHPVLGFSIRENEAGECLEDYIYFVVWRKPLELDLQQHGLQFAEETEKGSDSHVYRYQRNTLDADQDLGVQVKKTVETIMQYKGQ